MKKRNFPRILYRANETCIAKSPEHAAALEANGWSDDAPEPSEPAAAADPLAALADDIGGLLARVSAIEARLADLDPPRPRESEDIIPPAVQVDALRKALRKR